MYLEVICFIRWHRLVLHVSHSHRIGIKMCSQNLCTFQTSLLCWFFPSLYRTVQIYTKKYNESYISFSFSKEAVVDDGNQSADHSQVSMNSSEFQSGESILSLLLQSVGDFVQQCLIWSNCLTSRGNHNFSDTVSGFSLCHSLTAAWQPPQSNGSPIFLNSF